jgi:tetratricopeptide (TPR) repeat protein
LHLRHTDEAAALAKAVGTKDSVQGYLPQLFLARLAEAQGNDDGAQQWLERALATQQRAPGGELIPWIPAGEAMGTLALGRGDSAGAVTAFKATLRAYPNDPRALYGLAQALSAEGQADEAAAMRARFQTIWKDADTPVADALP